MNPLSTPRLNPSSYDNRETAFTLTPAPPQHDDNEHRAVESIHSVSQDNNLPEPDNTQPPPYSLYDDEDVSAADSNNTKSTLHNHDPSDPPPDYYTMVSTK